MITANQTSLGNLIFGKGGDDEKKLQLTFNSNDRRVMSKKKSTIREDQLEEGEYVTEAAEMKAKAATTKEAKVGKVVNIKKATKKVSKKTTAKKNGKTRTKGMKRVSKSGKFNSISELAFSLLKKNANITKEEMTKIVMKEYPSSNFRNKGHFTWYKSKFNSTKTAKRKVKKAA